VVSQVSQLELELTFGDLQEAELHRELSTLKVVARHRDTIRRDVLELRPSLVEASVGRYFPNLLQVIEELGAHGLSFYT